MKCAHCGSEVAQAARICANCGASQPLREAERVGTADDAALATGSALPGTRRGASIGFVIGACVATVLVAVTAWQVVNRSNPAPIPDSAAGAPAALTGQTPPPANQSAAPLPAPGALPPVDGNLGTPQGNATQATGAGAPATDESVATNATAPAGSVSATPAAQVTPAPAAAGGAAPGAAASLPSRARAKVATQAKGDHKSRTTELPPTEARPRAAARAGAAPGKLAASSSPASRTAPASDRWTRMDADLAKCTREDFISRVICGQRVRFRYCGDFWGKVPQCPGSPAIDHG